VDAIIVSVLQADELANEIARPLSTALGHFVGTTIGAWTMSAVSVREFS
jgi:hypothetical protein